MKFTVVIALLVCGFANARLPSFVNLHSSSFCRGSVSFFSRYVCGRTTTTTTTTTTTPTTTPTTSSSQSTGHMLGQLFVENFIKPAPGSGQSGSGQSGSGLSGRNLRILSRKKPKPKTCFGGVRDADGNVIAGNCNQQGSGRRNNRKKRMITQTKRDLLIMLDESGSVGRTRFEKVKRIAAAIVRLLCEQIKVNSRFTRVAVMSFDREVHSHIPLNGVNKNNGDALANSIMSIRYNSATQGRTCMKKALEFARDTALVTGGRRGQTDVEQDIIIITDGCANCNQQKSPLGVIREQTQMFINAGIHVYVIGVGLGHSCKPVLQELAQGGRCYHFFYLDDWTMDVDDFLQSLENPPPNVCISAFESETGQCLPQIGSG